MISILLADDHAMVRRGFGLILDQQPDFKVVAEASGMAEALECAAELRPDVVVSDVSMGGARQGLLLAERISDLDLGCKVVMLTMHEEQEYLVAALRAGALGYVLKSSSDEELIRAIRRAKAGEICICDGMLGGFVRGAIASGADVGNALTPRESEMVSLAVKGHSNQSIAERLGISVKTVESQKNRIMHKLGIETKPELFDYAARHGLI